MYCGEQKVLYRHQQLAADLHQLTKMMHEALPVLHECEDAYDHLSLNPAAYVLHSKAL